MMKSTAQSFLFGWILAQLCGVPMIAQPFPTLEIGQVAPDFKLPDIEGRTVALKDFDSYPILVMVFTCNHCPTAQSYEDRLIALTRDYRDKGVGVVAISPNDPTSVRLDELGYTDLNDTLEEMKIRSDFKGFNFPYLYDGETQEVSKRYGPVATPHVFIFNKDRKLVFQGRFDSTEEGVDAGTIHSTKNALDNLLEGKPIEEPTTKVFGCSVKWADKSGLVAEFDRRWKEKEVTLEVLNEKDLKKLIHEPQEKLRLINVWATWCGPCVAEFPDIVDLQRMYGRRNFEVITISADKPDKKERVHRFLRDQHAAMRNFIFESDDVYALIEAVDPAWQGALPYSLLVNPDGSIVARHQGMLPLLEIKRSIVDILGREKDW